MPFTYQGRLVDGNVLANGSYELRFRVFDQLTEGTQVGSPILLANVSVTNGLFTVSLDFGAGIFNGAARWLELAARPAGSGGELEVFSPRQPITAVPYALFALGTSGDAAALTSGLLPDARLSANIARSADLAALSNSFTARLLATNALLQARLDELAAAVAAIGAGTGVTISSTQASDAGLIAQGYVPFSTLEATGWRNGASANAPTARYAHAAVWTGQVWLVWGGALGGGLVSGTGAAYDVNAGTWAPISTLDAPTPRRGHTAVWTGSRMLVWGGFGTEYLGTGAAYSPATTSWSALPTSNAPDPREGHAAVWTGGRMVVWGGRNANGLLNEGATFDPQSQLWASLPTAGAPEARMETAAIWTGSAVLVWGGLGNSGALNSGGRLPVVGGTSVGSWAPMSSVGAPSARSGHAAVWTGTKLLIWGGQRNGQLLDDGAAYDPLTDSWEALPALGAPTARTGSVAAWTGDEFLIFGGETTSGTSANGAAYRPANGTWRALPGLGSPVARSGGVSAWAGTEFLVFGGQSSGSPVAAFQRLNPQPNWYLYRKP